MGGLVPGGPAGSISADYYYLNPGGQEDYFAARRQKVRRTFKGGYRAMLTLALDTATRVCSVAVVREQEILAAYDVTMGLTHSESLLPQIDQLFSRTGLAKTDIEKIAVSIGPGSFTGLRIGLAAAEAMAYAWHCAICGVNTLKALAYNLPVSGVALLPLLDAQKGNYYRGCYTWQDGKLKEVQAIAIVSGRQLLEEAAACKLP